MPYTVARGEEADETAAQELQAASAVCLARYWAAAYPLQYVVIRDEQGMDVAFRRPGPARPSTVESALYR